MSGGGPGRVSVQVFARTPVPGEVKTRLIPALGPRGAARLHRRMTEQAVRTAVAADIGPVTLWVTPRARHPFFDRLRAATGARVRVQRGAGLGARMHAALDAGLARTPAGAMVIGSDCPDLEPADLVAAADQLAGRVPVVLGPARDGGYYLIGAVQTDPALFEDIVWGGDTVLADTRRRLRALGWRWHELEERSDVDRPRDL